MLGAGAGSRNWSRVKVGLAPQYYYTVGTVLNVSPVLDKFCFFRLLATRRC